MPNHPAPACALAIFTLCLWPSVAHAEGKSFHNFLSVSRTIISPSQYYQLDAGSLIELDGESTDGSLELRTPAAALDRDIKGSSVGAAGFLALNPALVIGVKTGQVHAHVKTTERIEESWINPSLTYNPVPALSLGVQVNFIRGEEKPQGAPSLDRATNTFTFGMTAHREEWEVTAVLSTAKKDEDNAFNSVPQNLGLHARYRTFELVTLGLSYVQFDNTAVARDSANTVDESRLGFHLEAAMSETFSLEIDTIRSRQVFGEKSQNGNETVILGQTLLTSTLEAGAKITYNTISGPNREFKTVSPGLFLAMKL